MKGGFGFCHLKPELLRGVDQALETNDGEAFKYIDSVFPPKTLIRLLLDMRCCVIGLNWSVQS